MIERIKWYLAEVVVKRYGPVAVASAFAAIGSYLAAHAELLERYGVNYIAQWSTDWLKTHDISGPIILIELDTLSVATYTATIALVAIIVRAVQHHTTGSPVMVGGQRAGDPPKES